MDDYSDLTVKSLRQRLHHQGLKTHGNKADLIQRLKDASTSKDAEASEDVYDALDWIKIHYTRIKTLENKLTQPFPYRLGMSSLGGYTPEFRAFVRSPHLFETIRAFQHINGDADLANNFFDLLELEDPICHPRLFFFSYDRDQLGALAHAHPYLNELITSIDQTPSSSLQFRYSVETDPGVRYASELDNIFLDVFKYQGIQTDNIGRLTECGNYEDAIVRLVLVLVQSKTHRPSLTDEVSVHMSQIVLNTRSHDAFILESAGQSFEMEQLQNESIEAVLRAYIDPHIRVIGFDPTQCQARDLQGPSDLCAPWAMYIFLIYVLNSDLTRDQIYTILGRADQSARDVIILQFMYYAYKLGITSLAPPSIGGASTNFIIPTVSGLTQPH